MDSVADAQMLDHVVFAWQLFLHDPINRHGKSLNGNYSVWIWNQAGD